MLSGYPASSFFAIFCFQHDSWGATLPWPQRQSRCRSWTEYCGIQTFGSSGRFGVGDLDFVGTLEILEAENFWLWSVSRNPGKGLKVKRFISSLSVIFLKNDVGRRHLSHKSQVFQLNPSSWGTGISWFPLFSDQWRNQDKESTNAWFCASTVSAGRCFGLSGKTQGGPFWALERGPDIGGILQNWWGLGRQFWNRCKWIMLCVPWCSIPNCFFPSFLQMVHGFFLSGTL